MTSLRKWIILTHRYLGIALSLLFVVWFLSGIGMIYAGGMPTLTPELRLERLAALDFSRVRLSPSEAIDRAGIGRDPDRIVLLTVMDRPAYRLTVGGFVTVFADNGEVLEEASRAEVMRIAGRFANVPTAALHHAGVVTTGDQWTIGARRQMPLHKIVVGDDVGTELYVSPALGEVVVHTTRRSRALAWAAAIPHWLYFAPLRLNDGAWRQVVLWTSGIGVLLAIMGLLLGVIQFSPSRPFRLGRISSYIPYAGWMRWHYVTGAIFGVFTLTWVFSGLLSMEPGYLVSRGRTAGEIRFALTGGPLAAARFPGFEAPRWHHILPDPVKEVELLRIQDDPYYLVRGAAATPVLLSVDPLRIRREAFAVDSILARIHRGAEDLPIADWQLLEKYDAYYYGRDARPLPVLRLKFDDPDRTWVYIDPALGRIVSALTRQERVERWLYRGLHSLDFSFWYRNRPLWDIGVIALCLGGATSSGIGLYLGVKRLLRNARRMTAVQRS
jgi:hypothetical protein